MADRNSTTRIVLKIPYRCFSRYVIAAMLVDENKRFLISSFFRPPAIVHCSIVICVPRDWLQTKYSPKTTNRSNRQASTRVPEYREVSLMRRKWQIENSSRWIVQKILYSPNRTNRSNRTSIFSDRI